MNCLLPSRLPASGRVASYSLRRFAQVGENEVELIAIDRFGNQKTRTLSVYRTFEQTEKSFEPLSPLAVRPAAQRDALAIIIGIEKYRNIPSADFANRDARAFVDYAKRAFGIPDSNIRLLVDEEAGAVQILRTFRSWLPTVVKSDQTEVYVFFSGHGLPGFGDTNLYLLPHEVDKELLDRTAITQKEIVDAIQRTKPKSVTMFIDSCYSGLTRTGETLLAGARPISIVAKEDNNFPPHFTVISASAPDEISSSSPILKHGIFSYYLMRGMEGNADVDGDKKITVGEVQVYLSEHVARQAMSMNRIQRPQVIGDMSRILVQEQ